METHMHEGCTCGAPHCDCNNAAGCTCGFHKDKPKSADAMGKPTCGCADNCTCHD